VPNPRRALRVPALGSIGKRHALPLAAAAILLLVSAALLAMPGVAGHRSSPASDHQNVLLVVTDDMRHDGLWVMSSLGGLAERGVTFSRAFATTPLCCPSRASILTGLYAHNHGVLANSPPEGGVEAFDESSTLATWLHGAGVRTGLAGRYLNGYESVHIPPGWDFWFAIWQVTEDHSNYFNYLVTDQGERRYFDNKPDAYSTRVLTQQALRFLEKDRDRPFMLMLTPRAPHGPATADPEDSGVFKDREIPLPPSYDEEDVRDKPAWVREWGRLENKKQRRDGIETLRRKQLESLLSLDRGIATIVEQLRADGRLDRTWIIFTSDNGLTLGEHRLDDGKMCAYEECVRVPLVVVPPSGYEGPRTNGRLVANIDLAPTIADIMGVEPGLAVDGRSLLPLLEDTGPEWRDALLLEQWKDDDGQRFVAVRTEERKYVRYATGEEELYDQLADPYELNNVANDSAWQNEKSRLKARLETLLPAPTARR
jgi:arylsulfatase A-like enzyme